MWKPERLAAVGASAAGPLRRQDDWMHRRVESISFGEPDQPTYTRHLSVDFTIPELEPVERAPDGKAVDRYYVPVSFITKWPPLRTFDLRSAAGQPLPFLTSEQNVLLDAAALRSLALSSVPDLTDEATAAIASIPRSSSQTAGMKFNGLFPSEPTTVLEEPWGTLSQDVVFMDYARSMCENTILWLRVDGRPGERAIVKFSYDLTWGSPIHFWSKESFGLKPFLFKFDTPHLGSVGSYHLNVTFPGPLMALKSQIALFEPTQDARDDDADKIPTDQVRYFSESGLQTGQSRSVRLFTDVAVRQAKFYARGPRPGLRGKVYVETALQLDDFLRGSAAAAGVMAAILIWFACRSSVAATGGGAASVLLIAPAVFAYFLNRPSRHVLARGFLTGLRRTIMLATAWPLLAAAAIAAGGAPTDHGVRVFLTVMAALSTANALVLFVLYRGRARLKSDG